MSVRTQYLMSAVAASIVLGACGSSSSSSSGGGSSTPAAPGSSALVKTASNATLGQTVLVDSNGMTLYSLSGEHSGKFICTSSGCLQAWHPLAAPTSGSPTGSVGSLGVVKRPDGSQQVTYKGMPLYTFAADTAPGDAKGQGLKDVGTWKAAVAASGTAPAPATTTTSAPATTTSSSAPAGGGYGY